MPATRPDVFQLIAERETAAWEHWPHEHDRITALKSGNNMRPDHSFMLAWDKAFNEVFGDMPPRARLGSGVAKTWNIFVHINKRSPTVDRPNGWWTTELPELEAHTSTPARTQARKHVST